MNIADDEFMHDYLNNRPEKEPVNLVGEQICPACGDDIVWVGHREVCRRCDK